MREIGQVVKIEKNLAKVLIQRHAACGDCGACQIGQEKMTMEALVQNPIAAKVGEQVEIETETTNILKASFIIYTFPLILFILGSFLGYNIANFMEMYDWNNYIAFAGGILFTIISFLIIRSNEKKIKKNSAFQAVILRVVEK